MRNLRSNPFIEINLVDPFLRRGFRLKGRAEVYESGRLKEQVRAGAPKSARIAKNLFHSIPY
jgi:hypothetical protein